MEILLHARKEALNVPDVQRALKDVMCKVTGYMGSSIESCTNPLSWCASKSNAAAITRLARSVMESVIELVGKHLADTVRALVAIATDSMVLVASQPGDGMSMNDWNKRVVNVINSKYVPAAVIATNNTCIIGKKKAFISFQAVNGTRTE